MQLVLVSFCVIKDSEGSFHHCESAGKLVHACSSLSEVPTHLFEDRDRFSKHFSRH